MSGPIKVGDLVAVIGCHCKPHSLSGHVYTVSEIFNSDWHCSVCLAEEPQEPTVHFEEVSGRYACPLRYLKRIPPLEELEGEKRDEEITA